jgi:hypothetical protein
MKFIILLFITLTCIGCNSQTNEKQEIKSKEMQNNKAQNNENDLSNDFSSIWKYHQEENLGILGDDNYRFNIVFDEINKETNVEYKVNGRVKFKNNLNHFQGVIKIDSLVKISLSENELKHLEFAKKNNDEEYVNRYKYEKFKLMGQYQFNENKDEKSSGVYTGKFETFVYKKNNVLLYDDIDLSINDSYYNNHFTGIWKSNLTGKEKTNCWANFRIPCSKGLDIGSAEFSPSNEYSQMGWLNYYNAYVLGDEKALEIEKKLWD